MHQLPFPTLTIILFLISAFLFLATTFDSGSYISSCISVIGEPLRANRLFWAFALCLLPFSLMLVGGERALQVLKTASILASVPLIVIFAFMMISFLIILGRDRIKLEKRADKLKEVERRSLRIVQVKENQKTIIYNYKEKPEKGDVLTSQSLGFLMFCNLIFFIFMFRNWEVFKYFASF